MRRPLIAVNSTLETINESPDRVSVHRSYVDAVVEAGGLPLLVPPRADVVEHYLAMADGVLFTGGLDYPPALYGERPHPTVEEQTPQRTKADLALMKLARKSKKPALGICAGLQLLNIETGGGLIQHLKTAKDHTRHEGKDASHPAGLVPGTRLAEIFGGGVITVNSSHHQAADPLRLGAGLMVAARASDGTIEALEARDSGKRFFVFVQWHPERIADAKHRRTLFSAFIKACKKP